LQRGDEIARRGRAAVHQGKIDGGEFFGVKRGGGGRPATACRDGRTVGDNKRRRGAVIVYPGQVNLLAGYDSLKAAICCQNNPFTVYGWYLISFKTASKNGAWKARAVLLGSLSLR
jgi:hypothetical protein